MVSLSDDLRSRTHLAQRAGMHPATLSRKVRGREPVSREDVEALARADGLTKLEQHALMASAGYLPVEWDEVYSFLAGVLENPLLTGEERQQFKRSLIDQATWVRAGLTAREMFSTEQLAAARRVAEDQAVYRFGAQS
jgi:transcriptional regulator with XRE-family HTH domain